jgi:PBP1b-binding outer membrane lipoprotein LpoB
MFKKIAALIITVLFISCSGQKGLSKADVVNVMDGYFEKVKQNNFNLVESYYSDTFYEATDKERWKELYNKVHLTLGMLISTELESWNMRSTIATSGSGKYFTFVYNNKYENGVAKETINLFLPKGSNEVKIIGHNYISDAFLGL